MVPGIIVYNCSACLELFCPTAKFAFMSSRTKRLRIGVVLNEDVEAHIADYLALDDLCSLRTTERTARTWRYSGNRVNVPSVVRGVRQLHGILQCYRLVNSIDLKSCRPSKTRVCSMCTTLPQLSSLNLSHCKYITDVTALGQCPKLSSLISGCKTSQM